MTSIPRSKLFLTVLLITSQSYINTKSDIDQQATLPAIPHIPQAPVLPISKPEDTPNVEEQRAVVDHLEGICQNIIRFYKTIDARLEELSDVISKGNIKTKNKSATISSLRSIREIIQTMQKQILVNADPASIQLSLVVLKGLINHLNTAITNKLYEIPPFDITRLPALRKKPSFNFGEISKDMQHIAELMNNLDEQAKTAGLQWYNKLFRKIEDTWVGVNKNHLPLYGMLGTAAAATAFYWLWYKSDAESYTLPLIGWEWKFRDQHFPWVGWEFSDARFLKTDDWENYIAEHPVKWLGNIEHWVDQSKQGKTAVGLGLVGITSALAYFAWDDIKSWSRKQFASTYNYLRGGSTNLQEEDSDHRVEPRYNFDDAIGQEHIKKDLNVIVKYIEDPERFDRRNLIPQGGILFQGDTRTGKSFMAECLAGEIKKMLKKNNRTEEVKFFVISADIINSKGIKYILDLARRESPCIIFLDEIDLLRLQRDRDSALLSEFLSVMSGCFDGNANKMVIMMAATNKPSNMDDALRQHGRFGKIYHFDYPNFAERKRAITKKLESLALDAHSFDIEKLAHETEKRSFEDIDAMLTEALIKSNLHGEVLTQELLEKSLDAELRKIVDEMPLSEPEQELIATHIAGQALIMNLIPSHEKLAMATIKKYLPRLYEDQVSDKFYFAPQQMVDFGKVFTYRENDHFNYHSQPHKINQCKFLLAGNIAEKLLLGSCSYSYHPEEKQQAFNIMKGIVYEGIRAEDLSKQMNNKLLDDIYRKLSAIEDEVADLLFAHKDALATLAKKLKEKQTLKQVDIVEILAPFGIGTPLASKQAEKTSPSADAEAVTPVAA